MRVVDNGNDIVIEGYLRTVVCDTIDDATVEIYEDNIFLTSVVTEEGYFRVVIPTNGVGIRNFKVVYSGDSNYNGSESEDVIVNIREVPILSSVILTANKNSINLCERVYFTAICQTQYNEPVNNVPVVLKQNNTTVSQGITNDKGECVFRVNPQNSGKYIYKAVANNVNSNNIGITVSEGSICEIIADLTDKIDNFQIPEADLSNLVSQDELENCDIGFEYSFGLSGRDDIIEVNLFLDR